jgi:thiol-disulfide isomerase/thioredoxin
MLCPKCGAPVTDPAGVECLRCGVVLSKAVQRSGRTEHARLRSPLADPVAKAAKNDLPIIPIVAIALVVFVIALHQKRTAAMAEPSRGWESGAEAYQRALAEQKTESKPILLYFYTDWCGYCKRLDREVFSSTAFKTRYPSLIKVKVNPEMTREGQNLARDFGVGAFPTVYVISGHSQQWQSVVGFDGVPVHYFATLDRLVARW